MANEFNPDEERNLPASPRRLEQAREDGKIPRSRGLTHLSVIGTAVVILWLAGPHLVSRYSFFVGHALVFGHHDVLTTSAMTARLGAFTLDSLMMIVPVLAFIALAGAMASLGVGGWIFASKLLVPDFTKINPLSGLSRMFSGRSLVELGKVIVEATTIVVVVGLFVWGAAPEFVDLLAQSGASGVSETVRLVIAGMIAIAAALAVLAAVDVPLQLWRHHQSLRMTAEQVKRESRETEGDPQLRQRIRSLQREMSRRRMMEAVPTADVVVTNPTHFAVALSYHDDMDRAPRVVAKGVDLVAEKIRDIAQSAAVPVVESPALARALHKHAEIGEHIPQALYEAVAQVLAYVFRLRSLAVRGSTSTFVPVEIPEGFDPYGAIR